MPVSNETYRALTWADLQSRLMEDAARRRSIQAAGAAIGAQVPPVAEADVIAPPTIDKKFADRSSFQAGQSALDRDLRRELQEDAQAHQKEMFATKLAASRKARRGRGGGAWRKRFDKIMSEARKYDPTKEGAANRAKTLRAQAQTLPKGLRELALQELAGLQQNVYTRPAGGMGFDEWKRRQDEKNLGTSGRAEARARLDAAKAVVADLTAPQESRKRAQQVLDAALMGSPAPAVGLPQAQATPQTDPGRPQGVPASAVRDAKGNWVDLSSRSVWSGDGSPIVVGGKR